jgi:hypothetical protein
VRAFEEWVREHPDGPKTSLGVRQREVMSLLDKHGPYFRGCGWPMTFKCSKTEVVLRRLVELGHVTRDEFASSGDPIFYLSTIDQKIEAITCRYS